MLRGYPVSEHLLATGLPRRTIYDVRNGKGGVPWPEALAALIRGLIVLAEVPTPKLVAGGRCFS